MRLQLARFALVALAALPVAASADAPAINDRKFGGHANSVTMQVYAKGDRGPISANVIESGRNVTLEIVGGGTMPAKPVEIVSGSCEKLGPAQYRLPPFTGHQYVTTLKSATLAKLEDGDHAVLILGGNRTPFACGDLVKPNIFRH